MTKKVKKVLQKADVFEDYVREKAVSYILAGLGVVAGLAWNDAIKAFIEVVWPLEQNSLIAKFVYALSITTFLVGVSLLFLRSKDNTKK